MTGAPKTILSVLLSSFLLMAAVTPLWAQDNADSPEYIYGRIDMAFEAESAEMLGQVLAENRESPEYESFESYILKKIQELIIVDKLNLAMETALAVVDNNLQNFEAVDLYSSISRAVTEENHDRQKRRLVTAWNR